MVSSIALDWRKRILKACDKGGKTKAVAERFEGSADCVCKLKRRRRTTGRVEALPRNSGPKPTLRGYEDQRRALITAQPDATLEE